MSLPINNAYLALGSNIDAENNLPSAAELMFAYGEIADVSQVWESTPVGFVDQDNFLNGVVLLKTICSIQQIRQQLIPEIESKLNRIRDPKNKNAPRTIDVDLVLFNNTIFEEEGFSLPDPDILIRPFLIIPLAEISPHYLHPVLKQTLQSIAEEIEAVENSITLRNDVRLREFIV